MEWPIRSPPPSSVLMVLCWGKGLKACVTVAELPYSARLPVAITEFESALRSEPNLVEVHVNLANAVAQTPGRIADAIAEI